MNVVLAVDIGGTKLAAARVSDAGAVLERATVATPSQADGDAEIFFSAVQEVVLAVRQGDEMVCGVGTGGPMTLGGDRISPLNIPRVRDFPLRERLAQWSGLPTFVDNDAKALALGEGWVGTAAGMRNYLAMVVSTGIGGGIVLDGRLLGGEHGNAGHIGHMVVEPQGRVCPCGGRGCLEAEASGTAIKAITGGLPRDAPIALRVRVGTLVGRAIASAANMLDLNLAVIAGSVALGYGSVFFEAAQREIDDRARLAFSRGTRVVPSALGDAGPLVGAAAVGLAGLRATEIQ